MQYVKLGKTGIDVSRITFGCMELGGGNAYVNGGFDRWPVKPDEENAKLLRTAFDKGVTSFDTAELYGAGHSEEVVGRALREIRKKCIIATKISPHHLRNADVRTTIGESLFRLNTDYIDLYYIHSPSKEIPIEETMAMLVKLKEEGVIRAIGVSNFSLEQLKAALEFGRIDAVQMEYNLLSRNIEKDLLGFCIDNAISVMSYNSIAKGILTGLFHLYGEEVKDFRKNRPLFQPERMVKEKDLIVLLKEMADAKGTTVAQIAISWLFHQKGFTSAIIGTQNESHFIENLRAVDIALSAEECSRLDGMSRTVLERIYG
jgi:myo-inositol catabolism protein IolS